MNRDGRDAARGLGTLLRELVEASTTLIRDEAKLARLELTAAVAAIGKGTALVGTGAVLELLGALSLFSGLVMLAGDQWLPADLYWLAALVLLVITGGLALGLMARGRRLLSPTALSPDETVTTLKEDKEWLKQRLTSAATSR